MLSFSDAAVNRRSEKAALFETLRLERAGPAPTPEAEAERQARVTDLRRAMFKLRLHGDEFHALILWPSRGSRARVRLVEVNSDALSFYRLPAAATSVRLVGPDARREAS